MNKIRNFNQSLLCYAVNFSQKNPSHMVSDEKTSNNLFNDLNTAYSRLTTQNSYQTINSQSENFFIQEFINDQLNDQSFQIEEVLTCAKCKKLKKELKKFELALQEIETKFIQKELVLTGRFKQISLELTKAKEENEKYQKLYFKTLNELNIIKQSSKPPKIDFLNSSRSNKKQKSEFYGKEIQNLSTVESTIEPQSKRLTYFLKTETNYLETQENIFFDSIVESNDPNFLEKEDSSTIELEYTESEAEQFSETHRFNVLNSKKKSESKSNFSKTKNTFHAKQLKNSETELSRLKFQNDNLKNYNNVLLQHVKPKTLASKIFNVYRN